MGYNDTFLDQSIAVPTNPDPTSAVLDYTHFSLAMNTGRRLAWVGGLEHRRAGGCCPAAP